jgi:hypothetical protein
MTLNYLLRVSFIFTSKIRRIDTINFYYETECWFTPAKTGMYSSHESQITIVSFVAMPFTKTKRRH